MISIIELLVLVKREKAIEKVIKNGFKFPVWNITDGEIDIAEDYIHIYKDGCEFGCHNIYQIIFSHAFAEKIFGNHYIASCGNVLPTKKQLNWYYKELDWLADQGDKVVGSKEWAERSEKHNNIDFCIDQGDPECPCWEVIAWKYHLQQMVLQTKPIKYLKKFL